MADRGLLTLGRTGIGDLLGLGVGVRLPELGERMRGHGCKVNLTSRLVQDYSAIDMLAPHEKYRLLVGDGTGLARAAATTLVTLSCVDEAFRREFNYDSIYVLDEGKLHRAYPCLQALDAADFRAGIVALFLGQLIYKFTAALRFDVDDKSVKQVRINSWGRIACGEGQVKTVPAELASVLMAETETLIDAHRETYSRIVDILQTRVADERTARRLAELNASVPLSVAQ